MPGVRLWCATAASSTWSAPISHPFFTRDGTPPLELLRLGREQLKAYPTVRYRRVQVLQALKRGEEPDGFFEVQVRPAAAGQGGQSEWLRARKLLLTTGMRDELPNVPGVRECWGVSAFSCPYCHGHEVRGEPLALLIKGEAAIEMATLFTGWSRDLVICSNGPLDLPQERHLWLKRHRIGVREDPIARLDHRDGHLRAVVFGNGARLPRRAVALRPRPVLRAAELVASLGCRLTERGFVEVDAFGRTSTPGVHAAGDTASPMASISNAVQAGAMAASGLNAALIKEDLEREEAS